MTDLKFLELCSEHLKVDDSTIHVEKKLNISTKKLQKVIYISTPQESYNSWPVFPFTAAGWTLAKEYLIKHLEK
jgi:hypothetical protein